MTTAPTILDRYFELSDLAGHDGAAFDELIALFTPDATIEPNGAASVDGTVGITGFFRAFLARNAELKHVWSVEETPEGLLASWAVAGRRNSGEVFALAGWDLARLATDGRIAHLQVKAA
ncbi:nuclear transport factor 2 family protein [Kitasatospora sp. NPDC093558]|uniref:nuclear transport factor 2 family protein n=1 Tax=Kitasatospora sp. NPDC093558 TaxID=3155201 RepID=UPI00341C13EF